jgi:hypothetical protein
MTMRLVRPNQWNSCGWSCHRRVSCNSSTNSASLKKMCCAFLRVGPSQTINPPYRVLMNSFPPLFGPRIQNLDFTFWFLACLPKQIFCEPLLVASATFWSFGTAARSTSTSTLPAPQPPALYRSLI